MRYGSRGVFWLGTLLCISLFCIDDMQLDIQESIQRDGFGNPTKLIIQVTGYSVPVVDGMRMVHDRQVVDACYEYGIDDYDISNKVQTSNISLQKSNINSVVLDYDASGISDIDMKKNNFYCSAKFIDHEFSFFESMSNEQLVQYVMYNNFCKKNIWYGLLCKAKIIIVSS